MIDISYEKEYDQKLRLSQKRAADLHRFEQKHPAFTVDRAIEYPSREEDEEHSRLLDLWRIAEKELDEVRKKFFRS